MDPNQHVAIWTTLRTVCVTALHHLKILKPTSWQDRVGNPRGSRGWGPMGPPTSFSGAPFQFLEHCVPPATGRARGVVPSEPPAGRCWEMLGAKQLLNFGGFPIGPLLLLHAVHGSLQNASRKMFIFLIRCEKLVEYPDGS